MKCTRCELPLPAGAAHPAADNCVAALKERLADLSSCNECGTRIATPHCPKCTLKKVKDGVVNGLADKGVSVVEQRILDVINNVISGPRQIQGKKTQGGENRFDP